MLIKSSNHMKTRGRNVSVLKGLSLSISPPPRPLLIPLAFHLNREESRPFLIDSSPPTRSSISLAVVMLHPLLSFIVLSMLICLDYNPHSRGLYTPPHNTYTLDPIPSGPLHSFILFACKLWNSSHFCFLPPWDLNGEKATCLPQDTKLAIFLLYPTTFLRR